MININCDECALQQNYHYPFFNFAPLHFIQITVYLRIYTCDFRLSTVLHNASHTSHTQIHISFERSRVAHTHCHWITSQQKVKHRAKMCAEFVRAKSKSRHLKCCRFLLFHRFHFHFQFITIILLHSHIWTLAHMVWLCLWQCLCLCMPHAIPTKSTIFSNVIFPLFLFTLLYLFWSIKCYCSQIIYNNNAKLLESLSLHCVALTTSQWHKTNWNEVEKN